MKQIRFVSRAGAFLLALLVSLSLLSCTGGDAGKKKKKTGDDGSSEDADEGGDLQSTVEALLEKAKSGGASKSSAEDLESAQTLIAQAAELTDKGKADLATKKLTSAKKKLKAIVDEQLKAVEEAKKLAPLRTAAEEAKKKADAAKAPQNSPDYYKAGTEALQKGIDLAGKGTMAAVSQAKVQFTKAKDHFDQASMSAKDNAVARARAEGEKKALAEVKDKAKAKGAEEKAAQDWQRAGQQERDGDSHMQEGEFAAATESFRAAISIYQIALDTVQTDDANQKSLSEAEKAQKEADEAARQAEIERQKNALAAEVEPKGKKPAATPKVAAGAGTGGGIPLPDGFDPAAFPQDLDAEDEAFLSDNYKKLTPSGILEYDVATGAVSIDYTEGRMVQKDIWPQVAKKEFISYKPLDMPDGRNLTPDEKKKYAAYSFSGNTDGRAFFNLLPLRFYARVEWYMQILTMDNNSSFGAFLMYDAKKNTGYTSEWCRIGILGKGLTAKGVPVAFMKSANEWFDKKKQVPMVFEYKMTDLKNGTLTHIYNNDETAAANEKLTTTLSTTSCPRGIVGFWWKRTKFSAVELKITGILDKQAAVEMLRTKLKQPRAKAAGEKEKGGAEKTGAKKGKAAGDKEKPAPKDPDPTTSGAEGDGGADTTKKPAGKTAGAEGNGGAATTKKPFDF